MHSEDSVNSFCKMENRIDLGQLLQARKHLDTCIDLTQRHVESAKELSAVRTLILSDLHKVIEMLEQCSEAFKDTNSSSSW